MPAPRPTLDVWLYGRHIGVLTDVNRRRQQVRLDFTQEALDGYSPGSLVLSCSMPIDPSQRPNGRAVRAFFHGLLPEGEARDAIERLYHVARGDDFGLLDAIGRDVAGAVVLLPAGTSFQASPGSLEELGPGDLDRELANLEDRPLGADDKVRVSLPGVQPKLLLARTTNGNWARPIDGHPSTWILKPEKGSLPAYARGEAFCLGVANKLGLTSVNAELIEANGVDVVAVSRYDRRVSRDGSVTRIHQEDAIQALGIDVLSGGSKYEEDGGPSLLRVAQLLSSVASTEDLRNLLRATVLNVVVGNSDAHGKNLSLLHPESGSVQLAPLYDVTPTTFYRQVPTSRGPRDLDDTLGMFVNGKRSIHAVTRDDLVAEGTGWGLMSRVAEPLVDDTLEQIASEVKTQAGKYSVPRAMSDFVEQRLEALSKGKAASHGERATSRLLDGRTSSSVA
jgi:serine/threonine-protein kinase HipA